MSRQKRTHGEQMRDRKVIAKMYCEGHSQESIREWLNENHEWRFRSEYPEPFMSQKMVSDDWLFTANQWKKERIHNLDDAKHTELMKLDKLERTAWAAWERSCKEGISTATKGKGIGGKQVIDHEKRVTERDGDPRFLAEVRWCINKRSEILGFNAPKRREISGRDGAPVQFVTDDLNGESVEKLSKYREWLKTQIKEGAE